MILAESNVRLRTQGCARGFRITSERPPHPPGSSSRELEYRRKRNRTKPSRVLHGQRQLGWDYPSDPNRDAVGTDNIEVWPCNPPPPSNDSMGSGPPRRWRWNLPSSWVRYFPLSVDVTGERWRGQSFIQFAFFVSTQWPTYPAWFGPIPLRLISFHIWSGARPTHPCHR